MIEILEKLEFDDYSVFHWDSYDHVLSRHLIGRTSLVLLNISEGSGDDFVFLLGTDAEQENAKYMQEQCFNFDNISEIEDH